MFPNVNRGNYEATWTNPFGLQNSYLIGIINIARAALFCTFVVELPVLVACLWNQTYSSPTTERVNSFNLSVFKKHHSQISLNGSTYSGMDGPEMDDAVELETDKDGNVVFPTL